jgi:hypothetical protein
MFGKVDELVPLLFLHLADEWHEVGVDRGGVTRLPYL